MDIFLLVLFGRKLCSFLLQGLDIQIYSKIYSIHSSKGTIYQYIFLSGRSVGLYILPQKSNFGTIHFGDIVVVLLKWLKLLGFQRPTRNLIFLPPPLFNIPPATSLDPQNISSCTFPRSRYSIIFQKGKKWSC